MRLAKNSLDGRLSAGWTMALCYLAYMCSYMGRYNYSAVIVGITESGALSRADAGMVSSAFFFAYMGGQVVHTLWVVRSNPVRVVPVVLLIAAALNLSFAFVPPGAMFAVWFLNGAVQSALWPCMVRVLTEQLPRDRVQKGMVRINTSTAVGTCSAYLLSSFCMRFLNWKAAFFIPAGLMTGMALLWLCLMRDCAPGREAQHGESASRPPLAGIRQCLPLLLSLSFLCVLSASVINGFLRDGIVTWLPTYVQDSFHTSASAATAFSVLSPIAQFTGPLLVHPLLERVKSTARVSALLYCATALCILCLLLVPGSLVVSCLCFALCSMMMTGVNTALISLYPLRFKEQGLVAQASTCANTCVYLGSIVATSTLGAASQSVGWGQVLLAMLAASVAACVICLFASPRAENAPLR